jgi:hypothetical protein
MMFLDRLRGGAAILIFVMVGLGPTIHEFHWAMPNLRLTNSWIFVPSTTMTIE